jgi:hypothetical protein
LTEITDLRAKPSILPFQYLEMISVPTHRILLRSDPLELDKERSKYLDNSLLENGNEDKPAP